MKRIILIVMITMTGVSVYADIAEFYTYGEFAYYPMKEDMYYDADLTYFSTNLGSGIELGNLFAEVNQEVDIVKSHSLYFSPYREKYYVTLGFNFWAIQIGYQHLCTHRIDSRPIELNNYDKIYINFDTRRIK